MTSPSSRTVRCPLWAPPFRHVGDFPLQSLLPQSSDPPTLLIAPEGPSHHYQEPSLLLASAWKPANTCIVDIHVETVFPLFCMDNIPWGPSMGDSNPGPLHTPRGCSGCGWCLGILHITLPLRLVGLVGGGIAFAFSTPLPLPQFPPLGDNEGDLDLGYPPWLGGGATVP